LARGKFGWHIFQVGPAQFEARQVMARDEPETRHEAATLVEVADYANERGAGIYACSVVSEGSYRLEYLPHPRRTWRVVDSEGQNATGYEYSNEAQARDALASRLKWIV
jgi:hypothetical protein